jgi:tetratricopeptide (TPR) repeat protein
MRRRTCTCVAAASIASVALHALALVAPALVVCIPGRASAQSVASTQTPAEVDQEGLARGAMQRGIALYGKGDAAAALLEYERAKQLAPSANVPYRYAAEALLSLGRPREAIENFEGYLRKNPKVADAAAIRARIVELRAERLPGKVKISADAAPAQVRIDGGAPMPLPREVELPAGPHVLVFEAEGRTALERSVSVVGEKVTAVAAHLNLATKPASQLREPGTPLRLDDTASNAASRWKTGGGVTAGVGAAAVLTAVALDLTALRGSFATLEQASTNNDPSLATRQSDTRGLRTGVQITYISGIAVAAIGLGILLLSPKVAKREAASSVFRF